LQGWEKAPKEAPRDATNVISAIKQWTDFQNGQSIILSTPSVLVGYRVEVYRAEGTTQWYTAVIVAYNEASSVSINLGQKKIKALEIFILFVKMLLIFICQGEKWGQKEETVC
jgi:hypothetical protein